MSKQNITGGGITCTSPELRKAKSIDDLLANCPKNEVISNNLIKAWSKINNDSYKKIVCSISGGSDSDIMLDICWRCDKDNKIDYVWFDTGLEYQATKDHLEYLKEKYGIEIQRHKAVKPIPLSCHLYGQPFLSKRVSCFISRLQKHGFQWEDEPFEDLYKKYPRCKSALRWWCNNSTVVTNISRNKWLKEFIIENPLQFNISDACCDYAKKKIIKKCIKDGNYDLSIMGVRKAEGGARSTAYKSCFDENEDGCDLYRPLFWYKDSDKEDYEKHYGVEHSKCYTEYGLKRTGCAGCPFGRNFEDELETIKEHEPKLFKITNNIFGDSYEYTRRYREFCKMKNEEEKKK